MACKSEKFYRKRQTRRYDRKIKGKKKTVETHDLKNYSRLDSKDTSRPKANTHANKKKAIQKPSQGYLRYPQSKVDWVAIMNRDTKSRRTNIMHMIALSSPLFSFGHPRDGSTDSIKMPPVSPSSTSCPYPLCQSPSTTTTPK
jgi:hypothetical protein